MSQRAYQNLPISTSVAPFWYHAGTTKPHLGVARQQYRAVAQCCVAVHKQRALGQLAAESGATQIYGAARGSQSFLQIRQASRV
jgi:hypothetical protein